MKRFKGYLLFITLTCMLVQCTAPEWVQAQLVNPVKDSNVIFSDITTNNVSTSKHGYVPKATNTGNILKDDGNWTSVSSTIGGTTNFGMTLNSPSINNGVVSATTLYGLTTFVGNAPASIAGYLWGSPSISGTWTNAMVGPAFNFVGITVSGGTTSNTIVYNPTVSGSVIVVSGTATLGGLLNNSGVISGGIVSATTLRGVITNTDIISGGTVSGPTTFSGTLNFNNSVSMTSGTGVNLASGTRAPTTTSTTTVVKIFNQFAYGTWTPSVIGGTSSPSTVTYGTQTGNYVKIGPMVFIAFSIVLTNLVGGGGQFIVSGTPYVSSVNAYGATVTNKSAFTTNGPDYFASPVNTHGLNSAADGNTTSTAVNINNLSTTTNIQAVGLYITSE